MATAATIKKNIAKLEAALKSKATPKSLKSKLEAQLVKSKAELSGINKGTKPKTSSTKSTQTALQKLKEMVNKNKKLKTYKKSGVDLEKDADRPAKPIGKRVTDGTKYPYKKGNTYYEYRANRIDVKQPPKRYPKLEKGGYMTDEGDLVEGKIVKVQVGSKLKPRWVKGKIDMIYDTRLVVNHNGKLYSVDKSDYNNRERIKFEQGGYMAKGGETKYYKENVKEKLDGINEEISSINKYLKNLENENTEESYKASQNLRDYKSVLEAKKLHLEDMLKEKGGYMAKGGMLMHGFNKGDKVLDIYKGQGIVDNGGVIVVVNPDKGTRFIIDLDESKPTGRKSMNMSIDDQIKSAKEYIDWVSSDGETPDTLVSVIDKYGSYEKGGEVDRERMYNFLKEDLAELENAIEENNQEEIEKFFSYWNIHLKSLEPKTGSKRTYEFLKDDLVGLEAATKELPSSKEETDRFFSYWNTHLKSLQYAKGGYMAMGGELHRKEQ